MTLLAPDGRAGKQLYHAMFDVSVAVQLLRGERESWKPELLERSVAEPWRSSSRSLERRVAAVRTAEKTVVQTDGKGALHTNRKPWKIIE